MRQFKSFAAILLPIFTPVFAHDVRIFTFDAASSSPQSHDHEMKPETAELIFARRLGRSGDESIGHVDESVVQDLNSFGGYQPDIFGAPSADIVYKLLLVVDGADDVDVSALRESSSKDSVIPRAPGGLLPSLDTLYNVHPKSSERSGLCSYEWDSKDGIERSVVFRSSSGAECPAKKDFFKLEDFERNLGDLVSRGALFSGSEKGMPVQVNLRSASKVVPRDKLKTLFTTLRTLAVNHHLETTAVFLPKGYQSETQIGKRSNKAKRDEESQQKTTTQSSSTKKPSSTTSTDDKPPKPSSPRESSTLPNLAPVCHTSNSTCNDVTQNCSGHGYCYKKQAAKSGTDADDCYACKCTQTVVRTNEDGSVKRVQWGGPACQKKDVSTPFWLIGGLTVLLVFTIASAIGMMFSIGKEELPSVLSAGVTAPKKG